MTTDQRLSGVIKALRPDKGYGFISGDDGIDRFFHKQDFQPTAGKYFPGDRCVCGCGAKNHIQPDGERASRLQCLTCNSCDKYRPAGSAHAIEEGNRVTFLHRDEGKGPRAALVMVDAA